jgi:hypothetical protein
MFPNTPWWCDPQIPILDGDAADSKQVGLFLWMDWECKRNFRSAKKEI